MSGQWLEHRYHLLCPNLILILWLLFAICYLILCHCQAQCWLWGTGSCGRCHRVMFAVNTEQLSHFPFLPVFWPPNHLSLLKCDKAFSFSFLLSWEAWVLMWIISKSIKREQKWVPGPTCKAPLSALLPGDGCSGCGHPAACHINGPLAPAFSHLAPSHWKIQAFTP